MEKKTKHILLVDNDREIHRLCAYLSKYQFQVSTAKNNVEMHKSLKRKNIDLVLLNLMLPNANGLTLCQQIKKRSDIPVIILAANDDTINRIISLEGGADDYLLKPHNPRELIARIKAILRRCDYNKIIIPTQEQTMVFKFGGWTLDTATREVITSNKNKINLTSGEYEMLLLFLERPQRVLSRDQLLNLIHNRDIEPFDRSIDVQISRLRQKLKTDSNNLSFIKTIRNGGYILSVPVTYKK